MERRIACGDDRNPLTALGEDAPVLSARLLYEPCVEGRSLVLPRRRGSVGRLRGSVAAILPALSLGIGGAVIKGGTDDPFDWEAPGDESDWTGP